MGTLKKLLECSGSIQVLRGKLLTLGRLATQQMNALLLALVIWESSYGSILETDGHTHILTL